MDTAQTSAFAELWDGIEVKKAKFPKTSVPEAESETSNTNIVRSTIEWWSDNNFPKLQIDSTKGSPSV